MWFSGLRLGLTGLPRGLRVLPAFHRGRLPVWRLFDLFAARVQWQRLEAVGVAAMQNSFGLLIEDSTAFVDPFVASFAVAYPLGIVVTSGYRKLTMVDIVLVFAFAGTFVGTECIAVVVGNNSKCPFDFAHKFQTVLIVQE